jgi:hypothetical protein
MINPVRRKQVRRTLLETLKMAGNYALEESTMWGYVNDLIKPPVNFGERGVTLKELRDGGFIREAEDTLDPEMKQWLITELGKNLLTSL